MGKSRRKSMASQNDIDAPRRWVKTPVILGNTVKMRESPKTLTTKQIHKMSPSLRGGAPLVARRPREGIIESVCGRVNNPGYGKNVRDVSLVLRAMDNPQPSTSHYLFLQLVCCSTTRWQWGLLSLRYSLVPHESVLAP